MSHIHDCIKATLGAGHINELLLAYYKANGATSNDYGDAEREFLAARGATTGTHEDRWYTFLRAQGYTGSVHDMKKDFWCAGGGVFTP